MNSTLFNPIVADLIPGRYWCPQCDRSFEFLDVFGSLSGCNSNVTHQLVPIYVEPGPEDDDLRMPCDFGEGD
jgi:hypothetical protein